MSLAPAPRRSRQGVVEKVRRVVLSAGLGRTRFEDKPLRETVSPRRWCPRGCYAGREDRRGPRNSIEEFDPGSA
jgi:hypothetical protein